MPRYAGIKNNRIQVISNTSLSINEFHSQLIPDSLNHITNNDLILNYRLKNNELVLHRGGRPANQLKIALVGNYKMACGISTYNEYLWPAITAHVKDFHLFIEENEFPTGSPNQFGDLILSDDKITVCWKRGQSYSQLVKKIKEYDPDLVLISHEWGLFPNARHWLSLMTQLSDYRTMVILHSVFPQHMDKTICEAAAPEIIVHLDQAKAALQENKHIQSPINVVPHGCYPAIDTTKLWNLYRSQHTFIQSGFGHRYKQFSLSIEAAALLKEKYPDIFLTILFSESPFNKAGHQVYYDELMALIEKLGIQENVGIVRGFLADEVMDAYLRTNNVAVFPYSSEPGHAVMGSSGAARLAMSKGIPVISSNIPHFIDLPTIKAETAKEAAQALDKLFTSSAEREKQIKIQLQFIENNSWNNVAQQFVALFEGSNK